MASPETPQLSEAVKALYALFNTMWNDVSTYDPGDMLVSYTWRKPEGVELSGIAELVSTEDSIKIELACQAVEQHEEVIKEYLAHQDKPCRELEKCKYEPWSGRGLWWSGRSG